MNLRQTNKLLADGEQFPHIEIAATGGGKIDLPEELAGTFGVILIYRGSWCPYCNAQLSSFARAADKLTKAEIKVVAFSVDDEATTATLVEKLHLNFPTGHSVNAESIAAITGAFVSDEPRYLQSTGFVLTPDSKILTAVYSSGAIGRLAPDDVIGLVNYVKSHV